MGTEISLPVSFVLWNGWGLEIRGRLGQSLGFWIHHIVVKLFLSELSLNPRVARGHHGTIKPSQMMSAQRPSHNLRYARFPGATTAGNVGRSGPGHHLLCSLWPSQQACKGGSGQYFAGEKWRLREVKMLGKVHLVGLNSDCLMLKFVPPKLYPSLLMRKVYIKKSM